MKIGFVRDIIDHHVTGVGLILGSRWFVISRHGIQRVTFA